MEVGAHSFHKSQTRYLIKATPSQQWLVLKVTDDETCLKFRARSAIIINRFEAFSRSMTASMAGMPESAPAQAKALGADQPMELDAVAGKASSASDGKAVVGSTQNAGTGGGAGKKKKKKGKK